MTNRMIRVTGTKSGKSRGIPINDPLLEELRRLPRHLKTDYVFWNDETETRFVSIKKVWATTLRKVGIANFRFHDLRHTFASYVQMGPPLGRAAPRSGAGPEPAPRKWHQKWHRPSEWLRSETGGSTTPRFHWRSGGGRCRT